MKTTTTRTALFGPFELNVRSGELRKFGTRMKMGEQAFQILCMLLENPGEMVTREQLRLKLWPQDTFVDFDHGLNSAVQRLRDCLSDSAAEPRWIETIPRRGYRFVAPVEWLDESALSAAVPQNGGGNLEEDSIGRSTVILSSKRELRGKKLFWALGLFTVTLLAAIVIAREAMPSIP
jgi:DNA-binding winged helix-turn-helix (wHTH) protein